RDPDHQAPVHAGTSSVTVRACYRSARAPVRLRLSGPPRDRAGSRAETSSGFRPGPRLAARDPLVDAPLEYLERQGAAAQHGVVERADVESVAELGLGFSPQL